MPFIEGPFSARLAQRALNGTRLEGVGHVYTAITNPHFFFLGTLAPFLRASDKPISIACLRLFTVLPERPLLSLPFLRRRMAFLTLDCAFLPNFATADSWKKKKNMPRSIF